MTFEGLTNYWRGRSNDSVPSTNELYETEDFEGIKELARFQERGGAKYIDVNVGVRSPEMMQKVVRAVTESYDVAISVDSPDFALAEAGTKYAIFRKESLFLTRFLHCVRKCFRYILRFNSVRFCF